MWRADGLFQGSRQGYPRFRIANFVTTRYLVSVRWPSSLRIENESNRTRSCCWALGISHLEQSPIKLTLWANSESAGVVSSIETEQQLITQRKKKGYKSDRASESNLLSEIKVAASTSTCRTFDEYCPIPYCQNMEIPNSKWSPLIRLESNPPSFG